MLLREYELLMKAHALKMLDKERDIHALAWANQQAKATKKQGDNIISEWKNFKQFFDYEQLEKDMLGLGKEKPVRSRVEELMAKANKL